MDKINAEEAASNTVEEIFRERMVDALSLMDIPPFIAKSLEPARSEKEIAKCKLMVERAQRKKPQGNKSRIRKSKNDVSKCRSAFALNKQKRSKFQRRK